MMQKARRSKAIRKEPVPPIEIVLPATSANLGPAFDAAAIALRIHLKIRASVADAFSIVARGRDTAICGSTDRNLMLQSYGETLTSESKQSIPLALQIENDIPIGKGLGSS